MPRCGAASRLAAALVGAALVAAVALGVVAGRRRAAAPRRAHGAVRRAAGRRRPRVLRRGSSCAWSTGATIPGRPCRRSAPRPAGGRVPARELPRRHAHGRPDVRARRRRDARDLMDYLPRSNDPGCSAGFAHGLVTGVAPLSTRGSRARPAGVCAERGDALPALQLRARARPRVHADPRRPARAGARALPRARARAAPDCAQGAYHDYWFAVVGADDAKLPDGGRHGSARALRRAAARRSCGRAGTARSSTTARPGSWSTRPSTSRCSARASRASSARVHHGGGRDRPAPTPPRSSASARGFRRRRRGRAASAGRRCRTSSARRPRSTSG